MILIWWTNSKDCEFLGERIAGVPSYIKQLYSSRVGRGGRGRLWVSEDKNEHTGVTINVWPDSELAAQIMSNYAGIVIDSHDVPALINIVKTAHSHIGILTDCKLNIINPHKINKNIEEFERKFDSW